MKSGPALIERCSEHWFTATLDHFSWVRSLADSSHWPLNTFWYGISSLTMSSLEVREVVQEVCMQAEPDGGIWTYQQRYFLCEDSWARYQDGSKGPIFFYMGNEADVTLYVSAS